MKQYFVKFVLKGKGPTAYGGYCQDEIILTDLHKEMFLMANGKKHAAGLIKHFYPQASKITATEVPTVLNKD